MSNSNGVITAPVSIQDVQKVLGVSDNNIGALCKSGKVNPWSLCKPMRGGNYFYNTQAAFKEFAKTIYCGLTPQPNTYLREACVNFSGGNQVAHDYDAVKAKHLEWTYSRPTSGPFRITDYRDYRSNAIPPDGNYIDYDFKTAYMTSVKGYTVVISDTSSFNWYLGEGNTFARLSGLSIKTGDNSYQGVNQSGDQDIPISYIQGNILTEQWRFGIAVYLEHLATNAKWQLFVSDMTFARIEGNNTFAGYALPDLATNQQAVSQMLLAPTKEFKYLPCLVKNCRIGKDGSGMTYIYLTGDSQVYSAPSGSEGFKISITAEAEQNPLDNGKWHVRAEFAGQYAQFGEATYDRVPINRLVVYHEGAITSQTSIKVQVSYTYLTSKTTTTTNTVLIEKTFSANTVPSYVHAGAPGLQVNKSGTKWFAP